MIGRAVSNLIPDQPELKQDILMSGRILAHLILKGVISDAIEFE